MIKLISGKKAMTLIEIVLAVAILGMAIIPIVGVINSHMKKTYSLGGTRDYVDRAENLMEDLLEKVRFREIHRHNNSAFGERLVTVVEDLSEIKSIFNDSIDDTFEVTLENYNPGDYKSIIEVYDDDKPGRDTPIDKYVVKGGKTFFRYKNVEYYFSLEIKNIPLKFAYKTFLPLVRNGVDYAEGEVIREDVYTMDKNGNKRDMFKQLTLYVKWRDYKRDLDYSLVSFKANLGTDFDNE